MLQHFQSGFEISRHHLKGVYACVVGKNQTPKEVICSLREGFDACEEWEKPAEPGKHGPFSVSYQGKHLTLRPWDPYSCIIAAGVQNRLIHFPIRPGTGVFALDCTLQTLSHLADIVVPNGHLTGVIDENHPQRPTQAELSAFLKRNPSVSAIVADIQNASLERYQQLLSLPVSSRYAFLMGTHSRLGADSPVRILSGDPEPEAIFQRIFDYLECRDAARVKCLVVCHYPVNTKVEVIRDVVLSHIDILQRWRRSDRKDDVTDGDASKRDDSAACIASSNSTGEDNGGESGAATGDRKDKKVKQKKRSKNEPDVEPHWVLLDLPTDSIMMENNAASDLNTKLIEVVDCMQRIPTGARTGLFAKEQLILKPYFPNHALLLLKYVSNRDDRMRKVARHRAAPGLEAGSEAERGRRTTKAPSSSNVPVPSFLGGGGMMALPGLPDSTPPPAPGLPGPPGLSAPPGLAPPEGGARLSRKTPAPAPGLDQLTPPSAPGLPGPTSLSSPPGPNFLNSNSRQQEQALTQGMMDPRGQPRNKGNQQQQQQMLDRAAQQNANTGYSPNLSFSDDPSRFPFGDSNGYGGGNPPGLQSGRGGQMPDLMGRNIWGPPGGPGGGPGGDYPMPPGMGAPQQAARPGFAGGGVRPVGPGGQWGQGLPGGQRGGYDAEAMGPVGLGGPGGGPWPGQQPFGMPYNGGGQPPRGMGKGGGNGGARGGNVPGMDLRRAGPGNQVPTPEQLQYLQNAGINLGSLGQGGQQQMPPSTVDLQFMAMSL